MLELAYPWLLLLAPLPLVLWRVMPPYRTRRESVRTPFFGELAERTGAAPSRGAVVQRSSLAQKILLPVAWLLLVGAVARPQWVEDPETQIVSARDLMLAVDLSGSMETRDFVDESGEKVDRLTAVRQVLADFVEQRETDRLGLIVFGNAAFLQVPFTLDHEVFLELLDEVDIGMAGPKTMLGDALGLAIKVFEASDAEKRVLILLTDGNDSGSRVPPPKAADIAANNDITVHTIGVGDPETAGEAPMDEATLELIAGSTGGRYFRARDRQELEGVYRELDELEPLDFESYTHRPRHELYFWPLGAFVVLALGYHLAAAAGAIGRRRRSSTEAPHVG